jgi:16S rRNA (uracil1498-N3)-methyltransferase
MTAHRFFLTAPILVDGAAPLPLSDTDAHHAIDVLRLRVGELVDVVEPDARVLSVRVTQATHGIVSAEVVREIELASQPRVTLFQGVAKGDKMDDIVRQAVEVGAEAIVPVLTARSIVQLDERKRAQKGERWRRVAEAAAKQAKRSSIPAVADPLRLRDALPLLGDFDGAVVLWEEATGEGLSAAVVRCAGEPDPRIALIVGPEGGLAAEEVAALEALGATAATLGPNILRTETAAVVALALAIEALRGPGVARG